MIFNDRQHLEGNIMKSLIRNVAVAAVAVAGLIALPVASFAQTSLPGGTTPYPAQAGTDAAAAQQPVDASHTGGYGGVVDGSSQSSAFDHPQYDVGLKSIYIGH
jgi:hypothetical protein